MYARTVLARRWLAGVFAALAGLTAHADGWQDLGQCVAGDTETTESRWYADPYDYGGGGDPVALRCSSGETEAACGARLDEIALEYCTNSRGASVTNADWNGSTFMCFVGSWQSTPPAQLVYQTGKTYCTTPEPPACGDGTQGYVQPTRAASAEAVETVIGSCLDGCEVASVKVDPIGINKDVDGTFYFLPYVTLSGQECSGGAPDIPPADPTPTEPPDGEICKTSAEGTEVCTSSDNYGENCGYVNDNFVCLGKTDPDECWVNADGSRLCGEAAPTPPAPDTGTRGVKATPDDQIKAVGPGGTSNTYNFYNTSTVTNSVSQSTSGANPNRPSSQNPADKEGVSGGGGMGGEGSSASGGADCSAAPACSGDPVACAVLAQQWRTRCVDNPTDGDLEDLLGAVDDGEGEIFQRHELEVPTGFDQAGWMGAGSCFQDYTLNLGSLLGTVEIPFSEWCWLLEVIGVFVMIAAYVSAARIFIGGL